MMTLLLFNLYTIPLILKMSYTPQVLHVVSDDLAECHGSSFVLLPLFPLRSSSLLSFFMSHCG